MIVTNTDLANYMGRTFSTAELLQASNAIESAVAMASDLLCYEVDGEPVGANYTPSIFAGLTANATCGVISAGKFKRFPVTNGRRVITEPFTALRQVIFAKQGADYATLSVCTAPITILKSYQYEATFNGKYNQPYFNRIDLCHGFQCGCGNQKLDCTVAYVDADFGWGNAPEAVKNMVLELASANFTGVTSGGLKTESIEGHSYTMADAADPKQQFAALRRRFGACDYNVL